MAKRRVGTLSMAILLIVSGIVMLIAQVNKQPVVDILIKGWPVILFLLGGEILWYCYKSKEESPKVKYDIFSIFAVSMVLIFTVAVYGVMQFDVVSKVNSLILAKHYALNTPTEEFVLDETIQKVVIDAQNTSELTIYADEGTAITAYGTANVSADSIEKAKKLLEEKNMVTRTSGDTLYIGFDMTYYEKDIAEYVKIEKYTLMIPGDKKVEINDGGRVDIRMDVLKSDWVIDGFYDTEIRLDSNTDAQIYAFAERKDSFEGNAAWDFGDKKHAEEMSATSETVAADGTDQGESGDLAMPTSEHEEDEPETPKSVTGQIIYGSGQYKIQILNSSGITVNELR